MIKPIPIALVVARARNGVIGRDGALPWRIRSDLRLFKETTLGKPVIMGRKTWDSLPKRPLPGRLNIILTRDLSLEPNQGVVCDSLSDAVSIAREQAEEDGAHEVCVIGGAQIYAQFMTKAQRLYLTEVDLAPEGDARFPDPDPTQWVDVRREVFAPEAGDDCGFVFRVLERRL